MIKKDIRKAARKYWPDLDMIINEVFRSINESLVRGEEVKIKHFGIFRVVKFRRKTGFNFNEKKVMRLKPRFKIKFYPSRLVEDILNERNYS